MATIPWRQLGRGLDVGVLTAAIVLTLFGLAALYSFSLNAPAGSSAVFLKQLLFAVGGVALAILVSRLDYRWLGGVHWLLYAMALALLISVRLFGQTIHGTRGWFAVAGFQFQPVELVKVIMCVVLARYFSDAREKLDRWRTLVVSATVMAGPVGLVLWQPDFGSAVLLFSLWLGLVILLPIPRRRLLAVGAALAVMAVVGWLTILQPYQKDRILTFVAPGRDRLGAGYNVQQAITAIGSGQIFGRGLGLGTQSQLNYLPERQTDFIFASIGEELGLVGTLSIVLLFGLLSWRLWLLAGRVRENFGLLLISALGLMLIVQVVINIGMNIGLFPVTGVPLPFISYGGSSLLMSFIVIGIVESLSIRQRTAPV